MRPEWWFIIFLAGLVLEKAWKFWRVVQFFAAPRPAPSSSPLVSLLQPILSGDPTLGECLEANLRSPTTYAREFIWLLDEDDVEGQRLCQGLIHRYPQQTVHLMRVPPPEPRQNPKMVKLIAGSRQARGEVLCVLDDDTRLPDHGFEQCLPYLEWPGVGLVFGLPCYLTFPNLWSQWVACFVNSHSLMTYIPYLRFSEPLTINGMFYCMRRPTFDVIGGFEGLENILADDFAISQRIRRHGLRAQQTPVVHGISTTVVNARHYFSLIQRWFIFPRESLMRHLNWREQMLMYGLALLPMFFVWGLVAWVALWPSLWTVSGLMLYVLAHWATFAWFNHTYLRQATPWRFSGWVIVLQFVLPLQLLAALLAPQRLLWRGHLMESEPGGGFHFVRRRKPPGAS